MCDKNEPEGIRKIREYFSDTPGVIERLDEFLKQKEKYIENPTVENRIDLKFAYIPIYEDLKVCCYSSHLYSEQTFWEYVGYLKEGL